MECDSRQIAEWTLEHMPTILRIGGYRFFFFSLEEHEPPYIHVDHAGNYAKFWLDPISLARVRGFCGHELTEIRNLVEENHALPMEKWIERFPS